MSVIHGGDVYTARQEMPDKRIIDFSANINPLGTPEKIKSAVKNSIDLIGEYPDTTCREFCSAAAEFHNISADCICAGNGAADIIFRLVHAVKPKFAAVCAPTFGEYEQALAEVGCEVRECREGDFEKHINGVDMVFICNPNNPTGKLTDSSYIENIAAKHKDILFVIDECFLDMTNFEEVCSMINKLYLYPNIWVLKSLTKMYALAGLRIGYGICSDEQLCARVRSSGQPWAVSTAAQVAGTVAFGCKTEKSEFLDLLRSERGYLYKQLESLGFEVTEPTANFVFFRAKGITDLAQKLYRRGILVRSCGDYRGLAKDNYRVCIRKREDNEILINAIREVL